MDGYDRTVFVAVVGATPGVGKSTLCVRLAAALEERGLAVDHFREEEILTRPAYRRVAAEFGSSGVVPPEVLIEATASAGAQRNPGEGLDCPSGSEVLLACRPQGVEVTAERRHQFGLVVPGDG